MKFVFKINAQKQGGSNNFWYDLTQGGYIKPEEVLKNIEQLVQLQKAINTVRNFELALEEYGLLNEF